MNKEAKDILVNVWVAGNTINQEQLKFLNNYFSKTSASSLPSNATNLDICLHACGLYAQYQSDCMPRRVQDDFAFNNSFQEFKSWIIKHAY